MIDCALVTCENVPALDPDDRMLLQELRARGLSVSIEIWSDPRVDWAGRRLCVLRSTWDYHTRHRAFLLWIERAAEQTTIRNDPQLLRWNTHKAYLRELESLGVPTVPTEWIPQGGTCSVAALSEERGWRELVIKPALGAAANDVIHVRREDESLARAQAHIDRLIETQDVLVQPYLPTVVTYGERALIFFRRSYSHAVVKKPFDTILAVSDSPSSRVEPTDEEIAVATNAIASVPIEPLYARVDLLRDDRENVRVSEVELIEPGLYMAVHAPAANLFADAIEEELAGAPVN
jgi:glutathione synthase/RimK-type ligase-like ATP-grasp enzyme